MKQVATALLFDKDGKLLIYLRDNKASIPYPNMWDLFGGFIEIGETPLQALRRELQEELSLELEFYHPFACYYSSPKERVPNAKHVFWGRIACGPEALILHEGQRIASIYACERHALEFASIHSEILNDFARTSGGAIWREE